ncbi:MAG: efflux RND transporter periplasmic adaptor subunit [Gammaproteobacteria bacterium]|nr:efflux RND transporter periplasmic adaptor subunit [Gammaproteobacteria bacterium]
MRLRTLMLLVFCAQLAVATAQEFIPLTEEDIARLGIVFAPVSSPDRQSGNRFPATVVNSPESVSEVVMPFLGTLERWYVAPGARVHEGQVLADIRSQEVLELQNQWLTAKAELEQAEFLLSRDRTLLEQGIVSRQRLQETERIATHARIDLNALGGILDRAGFDAETLESLEHNPERLGVFGLNAPRSGYLTARAVTPGQYAEKYQPVATLGGNEQPWLKAAIPVRYVRNIEPGNILNLGGLKETVIVRFRELTVQESTQTVEVLAEFNEPVSYLPGQILNLILPPAASGILIPGNAVVFSGDQTVAHFRTAGGVEARVLDLEPAGSNYVAGPTVHSGEQVVIQGAAVLKGVQLGLGQDE